MFYVNVNENELPFSKRRTLAWGSRQSRPIEIKISRSVQINFWKVSRLSLLLRQDYFFSQSRFLKSRLLNRYLAASRFLSRLLRLSRLIKIFKICRDFSRFLYFCRDFDDVFCILETKILNFPHFLPILKPILKQKSKQKCWELKSWSRCLEKSIISWSRLRNNRKIHKNLKSLDKSR
jgi:hypothetical protein